MNLARFPPLAAVHSDYAPRTQLDVLLTGVPSPTPPAPDIVPGRYGGNFDDNVPGRLSNPAFFDFPPADPLAANKYYNYPGLYNALLTYDNTNNSGTMSYGTPVDLTGGVCLGQDLRGQPLYVVNDTVSGTGQFIGFNPNIGRRAENPYELNLSDTSRGACRNNAADTPFTVNELEKLLRPYDIDANMLPERITTLAPGLVGSRHEVTTESWSLPCPSIVLPAGIA